MTNFDEFKQKAKDTMETIADRSVEFYKIAEEKTKIFAKITRLSTEIALEKGALRKLYREIGKKYYELHKESPEETLAQSCGEVTASLDCITAKQKEIKELKNALDLDENDESEDDEDIEVKIIIEDIVVPADKKENGPENLEGNASKAADIAQAPPEAKL